MPLSEPMMPYCLLTHLCVNRPQWVFCCCCFIFYVVVVVVFQYERSTWSETGISMLTSHWCHNVQDGVSNHQLHHCLLNRLFRRRSKKISKLRVTGLCAGKSPVTGEFPTQMASNVENVSIWWRHHEDVQKLHKHLTLISAVIKSIIMNQLNYYELHWRNIRI